MGKTDAEGSVARGSGFLGVRGWGLGSDWGGAGGDVEVGFGGCGGGVGGCG